MGRQAAGKSSPGFEPALAVVIVAFTLDGLVGLSTPPGAPPIMVSVEYWWLSRDRKTAMVRGSWSTRVRFRAGTGIDPAGPWKFVLLPTVRAPEKA